MKKILLLLFGVIFLTGTVHASQYEIVKNADDLKIKIIMGKNPLVTGENSFDIQLSDAEGVPVTKARIKIDYSMPSINNMPTMIYKTRAKPDGEMYKAVINLSMPGKWDIRINIKRPGKSLTKMPFSVRVP